MHRVKVTKLLITTKLKECYYCVRMHSNLLPWGESITGYYSSDFKIYKQLMVDNLGVNRERADVLLRNNLHVMGIERERIIKNCRICQVSFLNKFSIFILDGKYSKYLIKVTYIFIYLYMSICVLLLHF